MSASSTRGGILFYLYNILFLLFILLLLFGTIKVSKEVSDDKNVYGLEIHLVKAFPS